MPNYEKLYFHMFNAVTDAIEKLQNIQKEAEDMYLNGSDKEKFTLIQTDSDN